MQLIKYNPSTKKLKSGFNALEELGQEKNTALQLDENGSKHSVRVIAVYRKLHERS